MHSSTHLIPGNPGAWPLAMAARDRLRELALRLFISLHAAYLSSTRDRHHGPTSPMAATLQTCLNEMKRSLGIACVLLLVAVAIMARTWFRSRRGVQVEMKHREALAA